MPNPRKNEKKDEYMKRCIPVLIKEGKSEDQSVAVCSAMYDEKKSKKSMEDTITNSEMPKEYNFILMDESSEANNMKTKVEGIDLNRFITNPVCLFNHDPNVVLGKWENLIKENGCLKASVAWDETDEEALKIKSKVDKGLIKGASIGALIKEYSLDEENDCINILKCELYEVSITPIPADKKALKFYINEGEETNFEYLKNSIINNKIENEMKKIEEVKNKELITNQEIQEEINKITDTVELSFIENTIEEKVIENEIKVENIENQIEIENKEESFISRLAKNLNITLTENSLKNENILLLKVDEYKKTIEKIEKDRIENYVNNAISSGKVKKEQKLNLLKLANNDFETIKNLIDSLPGLVKLSDRIAQETIKNDRKDWKFSQWVKNDYTGLLALKDLDPEQYDKLVS